MFEIAKEASIAVKLLENSGFEAYLVGGCVRDCILKRPLNDYDITTNALPSEIKNVFDEYRVIETGIKHGTVTVLINNLPIEITTYRVDGEYIDNRHPEKVVFSRRLEDDLCRRDFTVNAMAYNGQIVDCYGGLKDLKNKVIRCVGDPDKRFNEDALRIMRAMRFAAVLGFEIEDNTALSIVRNRFLLKNISAERIYTEFTKLLCGAEAKNVIQKFGSVFDAVFVGRGFSDRADSIGKSYDLCTKIASFFLKDDYYREDFKCLKPDNKTYKRVCLAIDNYCKEILPEKPYLKRFMRDYGEENLFDILALKKAEGEDVSAAFEVFNSIVQNRECYSLKQLAINGNDLKAFGIVNTEVGVVLKNTLDLVIDGVLKNEKDILLSHIKEKIK